MLTQLDRGERGDLRQALDTPRPDEDAFTAFDRWISTLTDQERIANEMIALIEDMLQRAGPAHA